MLSLSSSSLWLRSAGGCHSALLNCAGKSAPYHLHCGSSRHQKVFVLVRGRWDTASTAHLTIVPDAKLSYFLSPCSKEQSSRAASHGCNQQRNFKYTSVLFRGPRLDAPRLAFLSYYHIDSACLAFRRMALLVFASLTYRRPLNLQASPGGE